MRPLVTPAARENLTVGRKGDRPGLTAAVFSNVREHITVVYASPPLDLRLSPGERGKEKKVPVAFHVPYLEGPVLGCRHDGVAFGRKHARPDDITGVVLKCQGTHM